MVFHTFVWKAFVERSLWEGAGCGRRMCEGSCMWKVLVGRHMLGVARGKAFVERWWKGVCGKALVERRLWKGSVDRVLQKS